MDYREFMTKLGEVYSLKKGVVDIYNEAFKDKKEFSEYWVKFTKEYTSITTPPMPSFWLKEEKTCEPVKNVDQRTKEYNQAQITEQLIEQRMKDKWGI